MRIQILILGSKGLKQDIFIKVLHLSSSGFLELEIGYYMYTLRGSRGGGGVYSGFQVTGMIEGFLGFEIFDSGIFLGTKIWQVFFWVAWFE